MNKWQSECPSRLLAFTVNIAILFLKCANISENRFSNTFFSPKQKKKKAEGKRAKEKTGSWSSSQLICYQTRSRVNFKFKLRVSKSWINLLIEILPKTVRKASYKKKLETCDWRMGEEKRESETIFFEWFLRHSVRMRFVNQNRSSIEHLRQPVSCFASNQASNSSGRCH